MSICHGVLVTYALKIKLKIFFLQNYDTRCIFLQSTKTMFFCQFCSFCLYILGDILLNFFGLLNHCQFWKYDSISCETVSMALQDAPWSMPWCPWNVAVEIYNFLIRCPLPRRKCIDVLALSKKKTHRPGSSDDTQQWKTPPRDPHAFCRAPSLLGRDEGKSIRSLEHLQGPVVWVAMPAGCGRF